MHRFYTVLAATSHRQHKHHRFNLAVAVVVAHVYQVGGRASDRPLLVVPLLQGESRAVIGT